MTWGITAQRRAEEFDALVEGASTQASSGRAARDADLLELVGAMRAVPSVSPRPEFVADLRGRLLAEAATALQPADLSRLQLPSRRPARDRAIAAVVGGITIVGATTSLAVASQSALPGDSLYPVKRALESAHTGLSVGEGDKGSTLLESASDRLAEIDALTRGDSLTGKVQIASTLNTFSEQSTAASDLLLADYAHTGDAHSIAELRDFASSSLDRLAALEPLVPADARDELIRAAGVLQTIDTEAGQQCSGCGGTPIESVPSVLLAAAGEMITLPPTPVEPVRSADHGKHAGHQTSGAAHAHQGSRDDGARSDAQGGADLPTVEPDEVGPGSVQGPAGALPHLPGSASTSTSNPLQQLTEGLTGGAHPSQGASGGPVGQVVGGVGGILQGALDPLLGQSSPSAER